MELQAILDFLTQLGVTASATLLFAWVGFRWFGSKWLEAQFSERLERFKHEQNQEIERLRFRINALMDRTTKLHQHEFEVLPGLWSRIGNAFGAAQWVVSRNQSRPGLDRMPPDVLEDFFEEVDLPSRQRDEIRALPDDEKNGRYETIRFWRQLTLAKNEVGELNNYLLDKGIFIHTDLKLKVREMMKMIDAALAEREADHRNPVLGLGRFAQGDHLQSRGLVMLNEIEADVQSRLWDASKLD